jgi:hypothetical protein
MAGGFVAIAITGLALTPGPDRPNLPGLRNPFGVAPAWVPFVAAAAGLAGLVGCAVLAAWSLYSRARRGPAVERQQIKWLAYSGCLVALVLVPAVSLSLTAGILARIAAGALMVAVMTMPVAVAVAVLKYRLYDLDIVVRKTVVTALVAGAFTAIYALAVVAAGAVTGRPGSSPLTFAAAALAAVLLQPVRVRAGRLADRLVYGRRPSPDEVLSEFSGQMAPTRSQTCCRGWRRWSARRPAPSGPKCGCGPQAPNIWRRHGRLGPRRWHCPVGRPRHRPMGCSRHRSWCPCHRPHRRPR